MTEYPSLILWIKGGANDIEIEVWEKIKAIEIENGVEILEVSDETEAAREVERLLKEGWQLRSAGRGIFKRISAYIRVQS